ncbi:ferritin-like domain-containing protein [Mycena alexandri]|uniref:Ferritin-like domain-containing protein n=1 Tax=Mycena alexandri TaxID=1745969 RepID=A0AAD6S9B9_9AGAR|nr:ferritin-like domain-containing protein [Mycena alexandri]
MKTTFATLALALGVAAVPVEVVKRADSNSTTIDDTTVLNFALTLEHLENAFYSGALAKFSEHDFKKAGLPSWARGRFAQVAAHEAAHVAFLSGALGANATQPCNYSFPYTDPKSFAALSQAIEGVGVSAYTGAAQFITDKKYLTAAASVLSTEARHASWVASAVNKYAGWSGALDVPLDPNQVYSIASAFITSCPSTNPSLPFQAFPSLTVTTTRYSPGKTISLEYTPATAVADGTPLYVAFFTGLSVEYTPLTDNKVVIPADLVGQVYAVVTTSNDTVADGNTIAGPAILLLEFNSAGKLMM